jgi:chaperone modulatory protein CbpM
MNQGANMTINIAQWVWLNDHEVCTAQKMVEVSGLSNEELDELVAMGVITPLDGSAQVKSFHQLHVLTAMTARRLRDDFELNTPGIALAMTLVKRIEELGQELLAAQARLADSQALDPSRY